jgi:hypothetical protein
MGLRERSVALADCDDRVAELPYPTPSAITPSTIAAAAIPRRSV